MIRNSEKKRSKTWSFHVLFIIITANICFVFGFLSDCENGEEWEIMKFVNFSGNAFWKGIEKNSCFEKEKQQKIQSFEWKQQKIEIKLNGIPKSNTKKKEYQSHWLVDSFFCFAVDFEIVRILLQKHNLPRTNNLTFNTRNRKIYCVTFDTIYK